jgi:CubicO group peptidase (beta-lactamase class C family)
MTTSLDQPKVTALLDRARREIDEGLLPAAQVVLALDGEVLVNEAFGDATTDTRFVAFSSTKALVASVMWQLIAEGEIRPEDRVADHIPQFASNGKDVVTVEQVMLHTSGFPYAPLGAPDWWTREGRVAKFGQWRLSWEPGTRFEYHATSAHWVLAELIEVHTGLPYADALQQRVTDPLGLPRLLGVRAAADGGGPVATLTSVGELPTPDEIEAAFGVPVDLSQLLNPETAAASLLGLNRADAQELGIPGGGGVMRAADLALFYQAVLHNTDGLWDPDLLADVTSKVRNSFPDMLGTPANRSLGLVIAGDDGKSNLRGMGRTVSPHAFGHNGAGGQVAWADPATGLSFVYFTNGLDQNLLRQARRDTAIASLAAACVRA